MGILILPSKSKFYKVVCSIIAIAFSAFFLLQSFALLEYHVDLLAYLLVSIAVFAVLLYSVYFFVTYLVSIASKKAFRISMAVLCVLCFLLQLLYVRSIITFVGWDVGAVFGNAYQFANTGVLEGDYFILWKNNSLLFLLESFILSLFPSSSSAIAFSVLCGANIVLVDLVVLLTVLIAKKLFGVKAAIIATLFSIPLLLFNPYLTVPYSDIYALPFPLLAFFCFLKAREAPSRAKRILWIVLIGFFAVFGYHIKPTSILILVAILAVCGVRFLGKFRKDLFKKAVAWTAAALVGCFAAYACVNIAINTAMDGYFDEQRMEAQAFPPTLWLSMGLHQEGSLYGTWNEEDIHSTYALPTQEEKKANNLATARRRFEEMGPDGYLKFLYGKMRFTFGDGNFFLGLEGGHFVSGPFAQDRASNAILEFHTPGTSSNTLKTILSNAVWFLLLLALGCSVFLRMDKKHDVNLSILKLSVLGLIVFLMLFETRSRQLISYLPIFILIASQALANMKHLWENLRNRLKPTSSPTAK